MALLVYSDRCKWSGEIVDFIRSNPVLVEIVRFHNINTAGVPSKKITRVPTLVTNEGKMCVGAEVKAWLESMIPCEFESWDSGGICSNLDGTANSDMFELDRFGESLQPPITKDLEERISISVTDAFQKSRA
jgi:hypothetical protein